MIMLQVHMTNWLNLMLLWFQRRLKVICVHVLGIKSVVERRMQQQNLRRVSTPSLPMLRLILLQLLAAAAGAIQ